MLNSNKHSVLKWFMFFILGIIVLNLVALDVFMIRHSNTIQYLASRQDTTSMLISPLLATAPFITPTNVPKPSPTIVEKKSSSSAAIKPTATVAPNSLSVTSQVTEFFVPLGSGQSSADIWTNVPGLIANVNSKAYGNIDKVVFEASLNTPTGNQQAWVRLYNNTAKHPVWNSEMSITGGSPQFLVSNPITLDPGVNQYQVQMMTQLKYPTILDVARIHIYTN